MSTTRRDFLRNLGLGAAALVASRNLPSATASLAGQPPTGPDPAKVSPSMTTTTSSDRYLNHRIDPFQAGFDPGKLAKADEFIAAELAKFKLPGAGLMVSRGGKIVHERYWGTCYTRDRADVPFDGSFINMLYSTSKMITATVICMLVQDGLLDYDAPMCKYIPEFAQNGKEAITLRQLLNHSAGIPSAPVGPAYTVEQWKEAVARCCASKIEWPPGSKTQYHPTCGTFLAGEAALRVTGEADWETLCQRRLFRPLNSTLSYKLPSDLDHFAITTKPEKFPAPLDYGWLGQPGVGCFGTVLDGLKVVQLHLNKGVWSDQVLIKPEYLAKMHESQFERQIAEARAQGRKPDHEFTGLGIGLRGDVESGWSGFGNLTSPRAFGHPGIGTVMTVGDPDRDVGIMFLTTDEPKGVVEVRNGVTNHVMAALTY